MPFSVTLRAGEAFGDGEHPSTQGVLLALQALQHRIHPARILDMGCGSGILSLIMAKMWNAHVLAVDNDTRCIAQTEQNVQANALQDHVATLHSDGFTHASIRAHAPYDLIVMNILPEPSIRMARDVHEHLHATGCVILSGILVWRQQQVTDAYACLNMQLQEAHEIEDWRTLVLTRDTASAATAHTT